MSESSVQVVVRYLQEAVSATKTFEDELRGFVAEAEDEAAKSVFLEHAAGIGRRRELFSARLEALGSPTPSGKGLLSQLLNLTAKPTHTAAHARGRAAENLVKTFAVESSEVALYEVIANIAEAAGDPETEGLTRSIQQDARAAAETTWQLLPVQARKEAGLSAVHPA